MSGSSGIAAIGRVGGARSFLSLFIHNYAEVDDGRDVAVLQERLDDLAPFRLHLVQTMVEDR